MLRKLPISSVQDFAKIRNEYAVYADKTAYIHDLITKMTEYYFEKGLNIFKIGVVFGEKERNGVSYTSIVLNSGGNK